MAAENVDSLFMTLGLNLADLESGFVAADRTVRENIQRLNRENNLIRLRGEVQIAGLDETADAERILQIRQDALNQQMSIQRDRVRLLDAEFRRLAATHGTTNAAVQRAEVRLERERLALANLERESRRLNDTTGESNGIFDELSNMLPEIPTKFQAIGLAAGAVATGIGAATTAVQDLLEQFRELQNQSYELNMSFPDTKQFLRQVKLGGGDIGDIEGYIRGITDAYVKGEYDDPEFIALRKYGAQITDATGRLKDFKDITDEVYRAWEKADAAGEGIEFLQLTGGESGVRDIIQYFQRLKEAREDAAQVVNADIDTKQLHELDRAFGRLEEQSSELKAAIGDIFVPAAQAAADKLFDTVRDGTQFFVENKDAIQRWGFIAAETFSTVAEKWHELTSYSMPNTGDKDLDKALDRLNWHSADFNEQSLWGSNSLVREAYSKFFGDLGEYTGITKRAEEHQREYNDALSETKTVSDVAAKGLAAIAGRLKDNNALSQYGAQRLQEFKKELEDLQLELDFGDNDFQKSLAEIDLWENREKDLKNFLSDEEKAAVEAVAAARRDLVKRDIGKAFEDDLRPQNYEERLKLIEREKQKLIEAGVEEAEAYARAQDTINEKFQTSLDERIAKIEDEKQAWIQAGMDRAEAEELAQQRIDKARQEYADKIQEHYQNAADIQYNATHTAFEKEMRDIEQWQEEQQKKAETAEEIAGIIAEASAKEAAAFEKEVDRIKKANQSLEDKIFAQEHSQYDVDRRKLQQEVAELYKNGASRENIERYYNNALRDLNVKAAKGGDYTKAPTGANSGFQFVDYSQAQQQAIGLFTKESTSRQSVIKSLDAEQRKRLEEAGVLDKIIDAQNSLANSTEQAAGNIQDASSSIEIIHGDQIGGDLPTVDAPSLDDILAGVIPTNEFRELQTQTQEVTNAQGNLTNATEGVTSAEKNLSDATNNATTAQKNFAETTEQVKSALKKFSEDAGKLSGLKRDDTDVPTKMPTKSAPTDSGQQPEKVNLQTTPKDTSYKLEDLGFDLDVFSAFEGVLGSAAGALVAAGVGGLTAASLPALIAAGIGIAGIAAVVSGTSDNYSERLNAPENISLDAGEFANIDLTEIASPLSGIETNVQGIRDILQGRNAVEDANTESLQDTSTENFPDLLTPLTNINETAQSILQELQSRQDDESDTAVSELQSEISSRLSESASQITDGITAPIESLSQALSEIQTQNAEQDTAANEGTTYLENVAGTVQRIWDDMQAAKETETADAQGTDDTAAKLANIDTNVAAIWQKLSETTAADMSIDKPQDSGVARLVTIDEKVQGILTTLQDKAASQESPLNTLLEPLQKIDSPLSSIVNAITEKQVEIPTETIVQPLSNIANLIDKILSALSNREPPKVEISPNMDIDLGGAYVFDDRLKSELVNDITSNIVSKITEAVERATASISRSGGYGFGS